MDAESLRVKYLFSDQATKDRMIVDTMLQVQLLREENLELRRCVNELDTRKEVPQELKAMEEMSKRPKIISRKT